jgi:hypothetical protein
MKFRNDEIAYDEFGHAHGPYDPRVRDDLLRLGIMSVDRTGRLRISTAHVDVVTVNPHVAVCDFCATQPVEWSIDCADFPHDGNQMSVGGFAACGPCGLLVSAGDRDGLMARVVSQFAVRLASEYVGPQRLRPFYISDEVRRSVEAHSRELHDGFWQNYSTITRIEQPKVV